MQSLMMVAQTAISQKQLAVNQLHVAQNAAIAPKVLAQNAQNIIAPKVLAQIPLNLVPNVQILSVNTLHNIVPVYPSFTVQMIIYDMQLHVFLHACVIDT